MCTYTCTYLCTCVWMHIMYCGHVIFTLQPAPCVSRAAAVKAELSDTEGLRFKLDEKNHDIVELKKTVKIKVCLITK